jgi:hypothetical protein
MEESGFSPAKIAVLALILAAFVVGGYFATRSDSSSDEPAKVAAAPAAPADAAPAATDASSASTTAGTAADTASSTPADQANPAPAQVTPPPATAMTAQPAGEPAPSETPAPASDEMAQSAPETAAPPRKSHHAESDESAAPRRDHVKSPPPALAVLTPWWNQNAGAFHVVAVGPASEKPGIVVVFSTDLKDPATASQQLHLKRNGQPVSGTWQKGANNRVLALTDLTPGQYQLAIDGSIADTSSETLGATRAGPVFVKQ